MYRLSLSGSWSQDFNTVGNLPEGNILDGDLDQASETSKTEGLDIVEDRP